ncbi:aquaporin, partial [Kitasatospora sp. NPDC059571]|uniref:aquaporin n=1 Tax=Kitasatospora sp. NPDC059571 TaxID=3346871 RepID=UPI0036AABBB1
MDTQVPRDGAPRRAATSGSGHGRGYGPLWLSEFAATAVLLFAMVTLFRWLFAADSPLARAVPSADGRLLVDAVVSGAAVALLIRSPFGRRSGAHMNPAVSVAFALLGALPGRAAAGYVAAQVAGSLTGVAIGRLVWGPASGADPAAFAAIRPAAGVPLALVAASEAAAAVVLLAAVTFVAARPRWSRLLPAVAGVAVAGLIEAVGRWTGGSFNPARQFGPELLAGDGRLLPVFLLAPLAGAGSF